RYLAYNVNRDGFQDLEVLDLTLNRMVSLPRIPRGLIVPGDFSADGTKLGLAISSAGKPNDCYTIDLNVGHLEKWTNSTLAGIPAKTFDGKEIPAFLYLPKNAPKDHSLPTILSVHGGPESQERPIFSPLYQYFVSRGYAILAPNIRGSAGLGKTYLTLDNGPMRWDALKDLDAAVDYVGEHPSLNGKKVAILGGSYGGFAVLAMLAHYPTRFAVGVDLFGITDFKTFLANTASYRRANRAAEYGDPVKDSAYMDMVSPQRHADRITSPLLVIQGSNDPRVPESESRQIVDKLKKLKRKVSYMLFPDEGHGIAKLPNRIKAYEGIVEFLDSILRAP
ncbi:MAG: alpha/beta fold hydrolase, partial [Chthonomonadales bacterium]